MSNKKSKKIHLYLAIILIVCSFCIGYNIGALIESNSKTIYIYEYDECEKFEFQITNTIEYDKMGVL